MPNKLYYAVKAEKIEALKDTTLVALPVQSSVLIKQGLPEQVYRVRAGTRLTCSWVKHWEGANHSDQADNDDYYWMQFKEPLKGSRPMRWFGWKPHWREEHPQPADSNLILSEDFKKAAANTVATASEQALLDTESSQAEVDLGPIINLPGNSFKRPRRIYEPVAWVSGKPLPFTWSEFTKGGSRVPQTEAIALNIIKLAKVLTHLRSVFAQPLELTSGYRDPISNRAVGGARYSRHMDGDAADFAPMRDGICRDTWEVLCNEVLGGGLAISGRDGRPDLGFFHLDLRGGGNVLNDRAGRTFWTYPVAPWWGTQGRG